MAMLPSSLRTTDKASILYRIPGLSVVGTRLFTTSTRSPHSCAPFLTKMSSIVLMGGPLRALVRVVRRVRCAGQQCRAASQRREFGNSRESVSYWTRQSRIEGVALSGVHRKGPAAVPSAAKPRFSTTLFVCFVLLVMRGPAHASQFFLTASEAREP